MALLVPVDQAADVEIKNGLAGVIGTETYLPKLGSCNVGLQLQL